MCVKLVHRQQNCCAGILSKEERKKRLPLTIYHEVPNSFLQVFNEDKEKSHPPTQTWPPKFNWLQSKLLPLTSLIFIAFTLYDSTRICKLYLGVRQDKLLRRFYLMNSSIYQNNNNNNVLDWHATHRKIKCSKSVFFNGNCPWNIIYPRECIYI